MDAQGSLRYQLYKQIWAVLDYFYPPRCGGCGELGSRWCPACEQKTTKMTMNLCRICGINLRHGNICDSCAQSRPKFTMLRSWGVYAGPLRQAIHRLKYRRDIGLGEALGLHLIELLERLKWQIDLIVPIPLSVARQAERGYNQSALLARPISLAYRIPYKPAALHRIRDTESQVNLNLSERRKNVQGAFLGNTNLVSGKRILLVDDVATSGATLDAGADGLLFAGAKEVYAITLARAL